MRIMAKDNDNKNILRFVDLFAGIGGMRLGFEQACSECSIDAECVLTSEIKRHAVQVLRLNHPDEAVSGDITKIDASDIPDFDVLLAGFPCQAFSMAGKRRGFMDTRGTMFFEVERILRERHPAGFVLENVEGLVIHDRASKHDKIGRTLTTILEHLNSLGYHVEWRVLSASDFGVPQNRRRIYIIGSRYGMPCLDDFKKRQSKLSDVLEHDLQTSDNPFVKLLLSHYSVNQLVGKSINDKRGGNSNIHSWDIDYRGRISYDENRLMTKIMTERRKRKWCDEYGIGRKNGIPLTTDMIWTFFPSPRLDGMLEHLTQLGYLKKEYPKVNGKYDMSLPLGYNVVAGKISYPVSKILDPNGIAPTLVATDMSRLHVPDGDGIRHLTIREGLRLFGYPDDFRMIDDEKKAYDLLGNTVVVPVIKAVSKRLIDAISTNTKHEHQFASHKQET